MPAQKLGRKSNPHGKNNTSKNINQILEEHFSEMQSTSDQGQNKKEKKIIQLLPFFTL